MTTVFARVELRGTPSEAVYGKLHALMKNNGWIQHLPGLPNTAMPHAMYHGSYNTKPNLRNAANHIKSEVETNVWTRALVLVIEETDWHQSAG